MRIELPIETERLVIRPLRIEDAADLRKPEEWIREQIDGRRELDLGCVVATHAQLRGYATEASEAVVQAAFATGYDRITAMTGLDNAAALHVLEKLEFAREGETTFEGNHYAFFVRRR